jgi:aspartyl protease family protein
MATMRPFLLTTVLVALTIALVLFLNAHFPGVLSREDNQIELVRNLAILAALVGSLAVSLAHRRLGPTLRSALAWVGIGLALVTGYSFKDELEPLWRRVAGNLVPAQPVSVAPGVTALRATNDGHFHTLAEVTVGGNPAERLQFMIDTGASDVALTREDAERLGIDVERLRFNIPYSTANCTSFGARVRLDRVRIGEVVVENVAGSVVMGELDQSLLGMSFLRRLSGFEFRGTEMVLRQ